MSHASSSSSFLDFQVIRKPAVRSQVTKSSKNRRGLESTEGMTGSRGQGLERLASLASLPL